MNLLKKTVEQTTCFLNLYNNKLSKEQFKILSNFSNIFRTGRLKRLYILIKYKIFGVGVFRNLGIITLILFMKKEPNFQNTGKFF